MIDLQAYFRRIGYPGSGAPSGTPDGTPHRTPSGIQNPPPTIDTLRAICAHHTAAIPFENMDSLLGSAPRLAPAALQAKLVMQRRGGYCYELNALLRLVLLELGMQVDALAAWVVWMAPPEAPVRPRSHMLLKVVLPAAPDEAWLVDVGFGGHLLGAPLRFVPGLAQRTPGGIERLVQVGEVFSLEADLPAGWTPVYRFTPEAWRPVDYEPLNWFTATHPGSVFRHNLRLERLTPTLRATMLNDTLTLRPTGCTVDGPVQTHRIASAQHLARVLDEVFDIEAPVTAAELFERIPKGLDTAYLPPPP